MKKGANTKIPKTPKDQNLEHLLIENFVSLQKVMVNLSVKFDELSNNISKLLELFELSAKTLSKKEINFGKPFDEKKIIDKLEGISDQNKTIARGLALMHEKISGEESENIPHPAHSKFSPPLDSNEGYQKSIASPGM